MSIQAVLFDLDGTLLDHDMVRDFLPPYLEALAINLAHLAPPQKLVDGIMAGSAAITVNDGTRTNEAAFAAVFYPFIGVPREVMEPALLQFYTHEFPKLRPFARRKPEARQVVQAAFDLGYAIVIATNPYFPAIATQHRMAWAGVDNLPYRKVTSYENSHFAKPDLRYYTEILDELGCAPEEALVVGDESMDMVAAQTGCRTFLVPGRATDMQNITPEPTYQGTLEDVGKLLRDDKKGRRMKDEGRNTNARARSADSLTR